MIHDHDAVRNIHHQLHVVLDQKNGEAILVEVLDDLRDALGRSMVDARRRLIEQQKLGLAGEGADNFQDFDSPKLNAPGQLCRLVRQPEPGRAIEG